MPLSTPWSSGAGHCRGRSRISLRVHQELCRSDCRPAAHIRLVISGRRNPPHLATKRLPEQQPRRFLRQSIRDHQSALVALRFMDGGKRIESRIASRGDYPTGRCQTSKNVALIRDDLMAKLRCTGTPRMRTADTR
jgi:hypothetical protein